MRQRLKISLATSLCIFFSLGLQGLCRAGVYGWEFKDGREIAGWRAQNIYAGYIENDHLVVKGFGASNALISPEPLHIPSSEGLLSLRIETQNGGRAKLLVMTSKDTSGFIKRFALEKEIQDYRFYLGDKLQSGEYIEKLVILFPVHKQGTVRIDFIRFSEPSLPQLFGALWSGFWEPDTIKGTTINFVTTPYFGSYSFLTILYVFIIFLSAGILMGSVARKTPPGYSSVMRALLVSFLVAGGLFAVRMDYNWFKLWQEDLREFSGKEVRERIPVVFGGDSQFFDFIDFVKSTVPEGQKVRPAAKSFNDLYASLARYHLLPVKTSASARYLWVYLDRDVYFDSVSRSLKKGDKTVAGPVEPVGSFMPGAAIFKILDEEDRG
jgi:hypothetical protein